MQYYHKKFFLFLVMFFVFVTGQKVYAFESVVLAKVCVFKPNGEIVDNRQFSIDFNFEEQHKANPIYSIFQTVGDELTAGPGCLEYGFDPTRPPTLGLRKIRFVNSQATIGTLDTARQTMEISIDQIGPVIAGPMEWNGLALASPLIDRVDPILNINFYLKPALKTLSMRVINSEGRGVGNLNIFAEEKDTRGKRGDGGGITTDSQGRAKLPLGLYSGIFNVHVLSPGLAEPDVGFMRIKADKYSYEITQPQELDLRSNELETKETTFVVTETDPTAIVRGTIDSVVSGHEDRSIRFVNEATQTWKTVTAGADGSFSATLAPGEYVIRLAGTVPVTLRKYLPNVSVRSNNTTDLGAIHSSLWDESPAGIMGFLTPKMSGGRYVNPVSIGSFAINQGRKPYIRPLSVQARHATSFANASGIDIQNSSNYVLGNNAVFLGSGASQLQSKVVTPKNATVRKVKLVDLLLKPSERSKLSYAVSPDGVTWMSVSLNVDKNILKSWNTKKGLRWKIVGNNQEESAVQINTIRLYFTAELQKNGQPQFDGIRVVSKGKNSRVTITGRNFTPTMAIQFENQKPMIVKNVQPSGKITVVVPKSWAKRQTFITVMNTRIQTAVRFIL